MDAQKIDQIAELMVKHGLSKLSLTDDDGSVELERPVAGTTALLPVAPAAVPAAAPVTAPTEAPAAAPAQPEAAPELTPEGEPLDMSKVTTVTAPMVGVFYAAPSPGAEPFVRVGSKVHKGDTLCVIEAMKLMNEVTAEVDGEVIDVCAEDGELVEYGCCLMKIY